MRDDRLRRGARRGATVATLGAVAAVTVAGTTLSNAGTGGGDRATAADSSARGADSHRTARGRFSLIMMAHTQESEGGFNVPTEPWNGDLRNGALYSYRSIACSASAPVNNIASDLPSYNTRVRGSRAPSSMRAHPFRFRLVRDGKRWRMRGSILFTVCKLGPGATPSDESVPDSAKPKIRVRFRANFKRVTQETVRFAGKFRLARGTQRYEDLRGRGRIGGYFFCFAPSGCAANDGNYADAQFVMEGKYRDPTPQLGG